jgi:hypothetical protein
MLRELFGIPRSSAYMLEQSGEIRCVRLRKRGSQRGRVLIDLDSVRHYLERCGNSAGRQNTPTVEENQTLVTGIKFSTLDFK